MKKIVLLAFALVLFVSFNTTIIENDLEITGKWEVQDAKQVKSFTFQDDGYVIIDLENGNHGGEEFMRNGVKFSLTYELNELITPNALDLVYTNLEDGSEIRMLCIVESITTTQVKLAKSGFQKDRPSGFDSTNTMVLNKIK